MWFDVRHAVATHELEVSLIVGLGICNWFGLFSKLLIISQNKWVIVYIICIQTWNIIVRFIRTLYWTKTKATNLRFYSIGGTMFKIIFPNVAWDHKVACITTWKGFGMMHHNIKKGMSTFRNMPVKMEDGTCILIQCMRYKLIGASKDLSVLAKKDEILIVRTHQI